MLQLQFTIAYFQSWLQTLRLSASTPIFFWSVIQRNHDAEWSFFSCSIQSFVVYASLANHDHDVLILNQFFTNFPLNNCQMKYHLLLQILHSCVTQYLFEGQVEDSYCWCFESLGSDLLSSEFLVLESKSLKSESLKSESESHCCPSWNVGELFRLRIFPFIFPLQAVELQGSVTQEKKCSTAVYILYASLQFTINKKCFFRFLLYTQILNCFICFAKFRIGSLM